MVKKSPVAELIQENYGLRDRIDMLSVEYRNANADRKFFTGAFLIAVAMVLVLVALHFFTGEHMEDQPSIKQAQSLFGNEVDWQTITGQDDIPVYHVQVQREVCSSLIMEEAASCALIKRMTLKPSGALSVSRDDIEPGTELLTIAEFNNYIESLTSGSVTIEPSK